MNFQVELNNYCNFTCGYCPNKDMERKREFMSGEVWCTILNRYIVPYRGMNLNAGHKPTFIGHKDSEPLLGKQLANQLSDLAAVAPEMNIDIYSNGVLLPKLAERGKDFLAFLGTLPNRCRYLMSYHPVNHDGSLNDYATTFAYMKEVLKRPPSNVEFIMVSHLASHTTREKMEEWRSTWKPEIDRGVLTVHSNVGINQWTGRIKEENMTQFHGCPYGDFGHWFFGVTGNIIACCLDLEEEIILGNVLVDDPATMFAKTEEFYAEQRRIQRERTGLKHEVCRNCFDMGDRTDLLQIGSKK